MMCSLRKFDYGKEKPKDPAERKKQRCHKKKPITKHRAWEELFADIQKEFPEAPFLQDFDAAKEKSIKEWFKRLESRTKVKVRTLQIWAIYLVDV